MDSREAVVQQVVREHTEFFTTQDRDAAKAALLPFIVGALNLADKTANWGVLVKTDQNNKVPNDIVCWRPTMEIVDVLHDGGAMWDAKGVAPNGAWVWSAATPVLPPIEVPPTGTEPSREDDIQAVIDAIVRALDPIITKAVGDVYEQNERIFADLAAQNTELKNLIIQVSGRDYAVNTTGMAGGITGGAVYKTAGETVHLSPETLQHLTTIGASIFKAVIAARK